MSKLTLFFRRQVEFCLSAILILFVCSLFCSCEKSQKEEALLAANKAAEAAKIAGANWMVTNTINLQTNAQLSNAVKTFPDVVRMSITNDLVLETAGAAQEIGQLHDQGRLPGVSKNEHGDMTSDTLDSVISGRAAIPTYPISLTFHLIKEGDTSTNNYTLVKQAKDSEWRLQRAWETDSNGLIVREWPVHE